MLVSKAGQLSEQVMLVNTFSLNNVSIAATGSVNNARPAVGSALSATNITDNVTANAARQANQATVTFNAAAGNQAEQSSQSAERNSESVRVSSSIGRAASAGQLTREQALEIYRNIARFL